MNKRILLPAFWTMLAAVIFAAGAIWHTLIKFPRQDGGRLVWETPELINRITVETPGETITLLQENDTWVIKEADYYYADSAIVNQLFNDLRQSSYFRRLPYSEQTLSQTGLDSSGTRLTVYQDNRLLKSMVIGKTAPNRDYHYARQPDSQELWLISGTWQLPGEAYSWLLQPILEYPADIIEKVAFNRSGKKTEAARQAPDMPFMSDRRPVLNLNGLLERFSFFIAENVKSAQNFDEEHYPKRRQVELTTFSGLITTIDLYYDNNEYWVKISLSAAPLTTAGVNTYIRNNSFLYDGWFFKIPAVNGRILAQYKFN